MTHETGDVRQRLRELEEHLQCATKVGTGVAGRIAAHKALELLQPVMDALTAQPSEVERLTKELAEMVKRLELSTTNTDMAIKLLESLPIENGIRYDEETDSYIASHRITSVAHTPELAKVALASAIHMTSQAWPIQPEAQPAPSGWQQLRGPSIAELCTDLRDRIGTIERCSDGGNKGVQCVECGEWSGGHHDHCLVVFYRDLLAVLDALSPAPDAKDAIPPAPDASR
jgi:hypothetical protein